MVVAVEVFLMKNLMCKYKIYSGEGREGGKGGVALGVPEGVHQYHQNEFKRA